MENLVTSAGFKLERVHHDYGIACWASIDASLRGGMAFARDKKTSLSCRTAPLHKITPDLATAPVQLVHSLSGPPRW